MPDFGKALRQLRDRNRQPFLTGLSPVASLTLSTQLQFLRSQVRSYVPVEPQIREILPGGDICASPLGHHYVVRQRYSDDYFHGKIRLSRFSVGEFQFLLALMKQACGIARRDAIVFLDTETTGVHGGTGMCPFLIGVGHFDGDEFQMVQYFMRDFDEEPSMLHALGEFLQSFEMVVTYNGGSFDIPLLETRFTLARLDNPFERMGHFDLLNTARRLWRNGHGSCRLVAMERLLNFGRGPDIPGALIPRVYFDFLQSRPAPALRGVFSHNVYDVMSLAALTIHAADQVMSDPAALDDPHDLYSLARIFENSSDWRRSLDLYERALQGGLSEPFRSKARECLSVVYRRAGEHERAFLLCRQLMEEERFSIAGYEGAAVYEERIAGDMEAALAIISRGLERLDDAPPHKRWRSILQSRWERLQQKVIGFPSSATL